MPTTGALRCSPPNEPLNGALPKAKTPPSAAASQPDATDGAGFTAANTVPVSSDRVGLDVEVSVADRQLGGPAVSVGPGSPTTLRHVEDAASHQRRSLDSLEPHRLRVTLEKLL